MKIFSQRSIILLVFMVFAQDVLGQISGPGTTAIIGEIQTYSFYTGITYAEPGWSVSHGSIESIGGSGTTYSVSIKWNYTGAGGIAFTDNGNQVGDYYNVTVTPCVNPFTVGGGGSFCSPATSSVNVTLSGSETGITYALWEPGVDPEPTTDPVGTAGTGSALSWAVSTSGNYTVAAFRTSPIVCVSLMTGTVTVTNNYTPTAYSASGGGTSCVGNSLSISLSGSQTGTSYQLKVNGSNTGSPKSGTGSGLSFSGNTTNGTYTIVGDHNGCTTTMSGSATITLLDYPLNYALSGGGSFCTAAPGTALTLAGSQTGMSYQLKDGSGSNVGSPVSGTNGALTWSSSILSTTNYTVQAVNTSSGLCLTISDGNPSVTIVTSPTVYNVTGGGAICSGSSTHVTLSNTQSFVSYQLKRDGSNVGSPVTGIVDWTGLTTAGVYTVVANNGSCSATMNGSVTITVNALPTAYTLSGGGTYCSPGQNGVSLTLNGSQSGVNYQLKNGGSNVGSAVAGTTGALTWNNVTTAGTYTVTATNASTSCATGMSGTPSVSTTQGSVGGTLSPTLTEANVSAASFTITLSGKTGSVLKWQQFQSSWSDIANTTTTLVTPPLTTNTQYRAVVQNNSCPTDNSVAATITIYAKPVITGDSVLAYQGSPVTLSVPSVYSSYQWLKNGTPISGANAAAYAATARSSYQVTVKGSATAPEITANPKVVRSPIDNQTGINFHTVTRLKTPSTSMPDVYGLSTSQFANYVIYMDGLGRSVQSVGVGQSPTQKDLISPAAYDELGRTAKSYLPYAEATSIGTYRTTAITSGSGYNGSAQYSFYQSAAKVDTSKTPYAVTNFEASPASRVTEQGNAGWHFQPARSHTVRSDYRLNTVTIAALNNISIWTESGPSGSYADGKLLVNKTIDENNNEVWTFSDLLGRTLLKRVQVDETLEGVSTSYLDTYYVYDSLNNLIMQVPPKAAAKIAAGTSWTTTFGDEWCFTYTYDSRNRLVEKKAPGVAPQYYAYDPLDRLVLTQDGNLRASNKWTFIKYDYQGRPVMTGLYTNTTDTTRPAVQNVLNTLYSSGAWYEERGTTLHGYTNQSFPTANVPSGSIEPLAVSYYDNYDIDNTDNNGTDDYAYVPQSLAGETAKASAFGMPTGSKKLVMGTSTWISTFQFYDRFGRVIQVLSNNHLSSDLSTNANRTTIVYDFEGKVTLTKNYHNAGGSNQTTTLTRNEYDFAGRLLRVYHSINGTQETVNAYYKYNELGQLVEKNLHCTDCNDAGLSQPNTVSEGTITRSAYNTSEQNLLATQSITLSPGFQTSGGTFSGRIISATATIPGGGGTFMQSVDYRYHIRGWLKSINNAQLNNDSGAMNDDTGDYFGMELAYNTNLGMSNTAYYNGNISAMKWKTIGEASGTAGQRSYKYTYDKSDKLKQATFQAYGASAWDKEVNTLNEGMTYDHNGNIKTLTRKQNQRGISGVTVTSNAQTLDDLAYTYATGNQMSKVEDAVATTVGVGDFKNNSTATTEYTYDTNGNATSDLNKGISAITYNVLGKAQQITFSDGRVINYAYDASGSKLRVATTVSGVTTTTDYVGSFVYTNSTLSFFSSPEGRVVKTGSKFEYQYAISDHQGNTRILFTSAAPAPLSYTADMEASTNSDFQNYASNRVNAELFDHTDAGISSPDNSQRLTGASGQQVGVAKSIKVYPGDKVKIEAYAKYFEATGGSNLAGFASQLLTAYGLSAPAGGETGTAASGLNTWGGIVAGGGGSGNGGYPKAFVNLIVFDKNYNLLDLAFDGINGGQQTSDPAKTAHDYMMQEYTAKEEGYIYVYVSNENATLVEVYFDDVKVTHTKGNLIQANEYYPFGLQTANSWTRESVTGNQFLHNGGTEFNATSQVYDLDYRNYDPILGRMNQVDPMADKYATLTPYNYSANNPVYFNDPNGGDFSDDGIDNMLERRIAMLANEGYGGSLSGMDISSWSAYQGGVQILQREAYMNQLIKDARNGDAQATRTYAEMFGVTYKIVPTTKPQGIQKPDESELVASTEKDVRRRPPDPGEYRVRKGDNLKSIARKFTLPLNDLKRINGITGSSTTIYPGMDLKVDKAFVAFENILDTRIRYNGTRTTLRTTPYGEWLEDEMDHRRLNGYEWNNLRWTDIVPADLGLYPHIYSDQWRASDWEARAYAFDLFLKR